MNISSPPPPHPDAILIYWAQQFAGKMRTGLQREFTKCLATLHIKKAVLKPALA